MRAIPATGRVLRRLVRLSCRRPLLTVLLASFLAAAGLAVTFHMLVFKTSGRDLLPQDAAYVVRYNEYARDFGELDDIVVVVEARTFEAAKAYAARLVQELRAGPVKFQRIAYRIDPKRFEGRQLLYLPAESLEEIRDRIFDHQEFMENFADDPSLAQLVEGVNTQIASAFVSKSSTWASRTDERPSTRASSACSSSRSSTRLERPDAVPVARGARLFSFGETSTPTRATSSPTTRACSSSWWRPPKASKGSFTGDQAAIERHPGRHRAAAARVPHVQAGVTGGRRRSPTTR